jgi:hypothetical protein
MEENMADLIGLIMCLVCNIKKGVDFLSTPDL